MLIHPSFKRYRNQITFRMKGKTYKHCRQCGYRIRCDGTYLIDHFKTFHECLEPEWLNYGEMPKSNWYTNLAAHFQNPDIEL